MMSHPESTDTQPDIQVSLDRLSREGTVPADCDLSWIQMYTSLAVTDRSSAGLPVSVLAMMWGMCVNSAETVCLQFQSASLGTLSDSGDARERMIKLHDTQLEFCKDQCGRTKSTGDLHRVAFWHGNLLDAVLQSAGIDSTTEAEKASFYVEAFCAIDRSSHDYWADQFVRHVYSTDGGLAVAKDVVTDYRWILKLAQLRSLADVASQIEKVSQLSNYFGSYWKLNKHCKLQELGRSSWKGQEESRPTGAIREGDVRALNEIANVLRHEISTFAVRPIRHISGHGECSVHPGEWSAGDPGLAHSIVAQLGLLGNSDIAGPGTKRALQADGVGAIEGLVASAQKYARLPWLCPKQRCFLGTDRRGFERVVRNVDVKCCVVYSSGSEDHVAIGCGNGNVYLHRLDGGTTVCVLREEDGEPVWSMAVSEASSNRGENDRFDTTWLVVAHWGGVARIWDVKTARCVAVLRATNGRGSLGKIDIAQDRGRVVAYERINYLIHVWDITSEGQQKGYKSVMVAENSWYRWIVFEFAAAALFACSQPLQQCSSALAIFREYADTVSVSIEIDFSNEEVDRMECVPVQGSSSGALLAAVDTCNGAITVLDALTGEKVSEAPPINTWQEKDNVLCAAASHVDGRTLVVTSHKSRAVRIREAESGAVVYQWQTPPDVVKVHIDGAAGRLLALVEKDGLLRWSFGGSSLRKHGVKTRPSRSSKILHHALSQNGLTDASCESAEVVARNAATGNLIHRLDYEMCSGVHARAVAISHEGNCTLVVGLLKQALLNEWPTCAELTSLMSWKRLDALCMCKYDNDNDIRVWSASFSQHGQECAVIIEDPAKGTKEVHELKVSAAGLEKVEGVNASNSLSPACLESKDTLELRFKGDSSRLEARRSVRGEEEHCTCTAVAYLLMLWISTAGVPTRPSLAVVRHPAIRPLWSD